jgi:hypothetical protein
MVSIWEFIFELSLGEALAAILPDTGIFNSSFISVGDSLTSD